MTFSHDGGDSSRGRLGVAIRKSFGEADTGWLWTPYVTLSAVREFDGESLFIINDTFVGATNVEGTSALLELGFTARHQNWSIYGGLNWEDGGAIDSLLRRPVGRSLHLRWSGPGAAPVGAPAKTCAELDDDGDGVNNCDDSAWVPPPASKWVRTVARCPRRRRSRSRSPSAADRSDIFGKASPAERSAGLCISCGPDPVSGHFWLFMNGPLGQNSRSGPEAHDSEKQVANKKQAAEAIQEVGDKSQMDTGLEPSTRK
jgi:hypothetical protein